MRLLLRLILPLAAVGLLSTGCEQPITSPRLDFIAVNNTLTNDRVASAADTFEVRAFAETLEGDPQLRRFTVTAKEVYFESRSIPNQGETRDPLVYFDTVFSAGNAPRSFLFVNRFGASTNSGRQTWTYTVTDADGNKASRGYRLTVRQADSLNAVHSYSVRLQAPRRSNSRASLAALRGFVLPPHATRQPDYQQLADLLYLPGSTGPRLGAPSSYAARTHPVLRTKFWQTRRATRLALTGLTQSEFTSISTAEALSDAVTAAALLPDTAVAAPRGRVLAFRTADGSDGLVYVNSLGPTAPVDLILDVKVRRR